MGFIDWALSNLFIEWLPYEYTIMFAWENRKKKLRQFSFVGILQYDIKDKKNE